MSIPTQSEEANGLARIGSLLEGLDQKAGPKDFWAKQQAAVLAFGRRTSAQPPLKVLLEDAAAMIAEVLELDRIGVGEVEASGSELTLRVATLTKQGVLIDPLYHRYSMDPSSSMAIYTLQVAAPVQSSHLLEEKRFTDLFLRKIQVAGALMLPLIVGGRPFGVLGVFAREKRTFGMDDIQFAETISYLLISSLGRIKAEQELQHHQTLAQSVLELIDALVVNLDEEGRIQQINTNVQKITNYQPQEIIGRFFWETLVPSDQAELVRTIFRQTLTTSKPTQFAVHLVDKYNQKRRICWTIKSLREGPQPSIILCGTDQTELVQLKEELRRVSQRVEKTTHTLQELCEILQTNPNVVPGEILATLQQLSTPAEPPSHPFQPLHQWVPEEHRQFVRRSYRYRQKIAPYTEGRFPRPDEFIEVQCKDISAGGIGFFMEKEPSFRRLVLALGEGGATSYFLAEVVRSVPVDHQGQKLYLVGCKFCGRLSPP